MVITLSNKFRSMISAIFFSILALVYFVLACEEYGVYFFADVVIVVGSVVFAIDNWFRFFNDKRA